MPIGARAVARPVSTAESAGTGDAALPPTRGARADLPLHCWVVHGSGPAAERVPGILLEWRHEAERWWGMVVFVAGDDGGHPVVVTRLLPAEALSPA